MLKGEKAGDRILFQANRVNRQSPVVSIRREMTIFGGRALAWFNAGMRSRRQSFDQSGLTFPRSEGRASLRSQLGEVSHDRQPCRRPPLPRWGIIIPMATMLGGIITMILQRTPDR